MPVTEIFRGLIRCRHLLFMLTWRDLRLRYKQTVMGILLALLMPMLIVASGLLVKKAFSIVSGQTLTVLDVASVSVKALPWAFFVASVRFASNSLLANSNPATKMYMPREVFPLSAVLANLSDFAIASGVLIVALAVMGIGASVHLVWLPVLLTLLVLLTMGISMLVACANLFFRDVRQIVEVVLTFGIFFTPVLYEASTFGEWAPVLLLNPISPLLEGLNDVVVLHHAPDLLWLGYAACWAIGGFLIGLKIFAAAEPKFAENI